MKRLFFAGCVMSALAITSCSQDVEEVNQDTQNIDANLDILNDVLLDQTGASEVIPGQYIVVYTNEVSTAAGKESVQDTKAAIIGLTNNILGLTEARSATVIKNVYANAIAGVTIELDENQLRTIQNDRRVAIVEQDRIVQFAPPCGTPNGGPCDGGGGDGGGGSSTQETPWGIARVNGVASYTGSAKAYVLDSGIDLDHPDLNVDAAAGFNAFTSGKDGKSLDDGNGHGTHVAGTIGAINNDFGVIGVAPGATVVPVKVLDSRGSGSYSGVIAGVDHVAANANNGDVANMSLGGPVSEALEAAIASAAQGGVNFMLAAGNESQDANNVSPARVNGANIYTISAMSQGDNWASYSNFGNPPVDYCAPGSAVKSTWKSGGYNTISGTSMATPHAAGVLLLGNASTSGTVNGDPDGNPDPIIVH